MQPKTIKSKNNGCGTAPGNLVISFIVANVWKIFFKLGSVDTSTDNFVKRNPIYI